MIESNTWQNASLFGSAGVMAAQATPAAQNSVNTTRTQTCNNINTYGLYLNCVLLLTCSRSFECSMANKVIYGH